MSRAEELFVTVWVPLTDAAMCINLINDFLLSLVISYAVF